MNTLQLGSNPSLEGGLKYFRFLLVKFWVDLGRYGT